MLSHAGQQSGERKNGSFSLSFHELHGTTTLAEKPEKAQSLKEKYDIADTKLLRLEEELDVLLHCAQLLRDQRTELTIGRLEYSDSSPNAAKLQGSDQLIDSYLALAAKSKAVDDMIKAVKEECAAARSECSHLLAGIRRSSSDGFLQKLKNKDTLAHGGPDSGFTDREAIAERIMTAEHTATNVAGVVGAFGAGITYTTLNTTTRGRLDLISWAFTCFLMVVIDCAALQVFALPRHGQLDRLFRMEYSGSAESRLLIYMLLVGIPMVTGFLLLGVSVALLDANSSEPIPGSHIAIQAAGYLPIASLGYFVGVAVVAGLGAVVVRLLPRYLLPSREQMPAEAQRYYSSIMSPVKEKLHFLPGGPGYALYRQKRRSGRNL